MSKKILAKLVIEVHYEDESGRMTVEEMQREAKALLKQIAESAAGNGQMSGESNMIVESWDAEVSVQAKS